VLDDEVELLEVDIVVLGDCETAYTPKIIRNRTNQVPSDVDFGTAAPQLGQVFALLLTFSPHSLHFIRAIEILRVLAYYFLKMSIARIRRLIHITPQIMDRAIALALID